eukprot:2193963-Pyramimonas_sp.AAC.1
MVSHLQEGAAVVGEELVLGVVHVAVAKASVARQQGGHRRVLRERRHLRVARHALLPHLRAKATGRPAQSVSYTHLRAHETGAYL